MKRIDTFKNAMTSRKALKVIAGINNFDMEKVRNVVSAATQGGAHAVDICCNKKIFDMSREMTELPIFVSSVVPSELAMAAEWGADAIELGNYDALTREGRMVSADEVWSWARETKSLLNGKDVFFSVTIPGHISMTEQIELAHKLESLHIDLIQTEGSMVSEHHSTGVMGLMETAMRTMANTMEISANTEIPVMTASGISVKTIAMAFASGASAVGVGSAVNKCDSLISMIATVRGLVEASSKWSWNSSRETLNV
ncbi:MAG: DUF561 domain-containing protein [Candidatus Gastranaerophilaceae bacterium]